MYFVESVEVEGGSVAGEVVEVVMRWTLLNLFLACIATIFLIVAWAPGVPWFFLDFFVSCCRFCTWPLANSFFNPHRPPPNSSRPPHFPPERLPRGGAERGRGLGRPHLHDR